MIYTRNRKKIATIEKTERRLKVILSSALTLICSLGAEIGVIASEAVLVIAGGAVLIVLARKLKPREKKNVPVVLPELGEERPVCATDAPQEEKQAEKSADNCEKEQKEVPAPEQSDEGKETAQEISEEKDSAREEQIGQSQDENPSEQKQAQPEQEETQEEQTPVAEQAPPAPARRSAREIFAAYEKAAGIQPEEPPVRQPDREQIEHEQDVMELKRYMQSLKSGNVSQEEHRRTMGDPLPVQPESGTYINPSQPLQSDGGTYVRPDNSVKSEPAKYIDPANPDRSGDEGFAAYNQTDSAYLKKHIEQERKRHEATAHAEQEKVDWNRVKQYNSAILSMGEIKPDDDKNK